MVEVSLTVGKLDASLAVLLTKDHHLIEFPTILLPNGVKGGSIVKIKCEHDVVTELEEKKRFQDIQDEIFTMFGKNVPKSPILTVKNVTQTSCVLQWEPLDLGTASFKSLVLYRDNVKLFSVPNPLSNRTTKLSGLAIDKEFKFQLRLDTTAGVFLSEQISVTTHKMTDLSGINVCVQDISPNEHFTIDDINLALKNMGAHSPAHDKMKVDTTHYVTTRENKENVEFIKANEMNIPIIRPEWLKACERERRIVGVLNFYVKDCALPTIFAENYWGNSANRNKSAPSGVAQNNNLPRVEITDLTKNDDISQNGAVLERDVNGKVEETSKKVEEKVEEKDITLGKSEEATFEVEGSMTTAGQEESNNKSVVIDADNENKSIKKESQSEEKESSKDESNTVIEAQAESSVEDEAKKKEEPVEEDLGEENDASESPESLAADLPSTSEEEKQDESKEQDKTVDNTESVEVNGEADAIKASDGLEVVDLNN